MSKLVLIVSVAVLSTFCYGRHIRPYSTVDEDTADIVESELGIDGMTIEELQHIKPSHMVPINHALFFRRYSPCAEGLKRDIFGICREVWD